MLMDKGLQWDPVGCISSKLVPRGTVLHNSPCIHQLWGSAPGLPTHALGQWGRHGLVERKVALVLWTLSHPHMGSEHTGAGVEAQAQSPISSSLAPQDLPNTGTYHPPPLRDL